ncbi:hypothetical protein TEA_026785 [Camellia sinensis var. sinensis]|uniref:SAC3/GANP/THP3 conserved domain-containing protein n=1 Tax=Camellia sinensis var. sinensis TaxID=542762 RepID=A0A4S4D6J3_CAMSN|nr:hypothetical protein TEA_026785 [Camellia sinensis var. sinensis]
MFASRSSARLSSRPVSRSFRPSKTDPLGVSVEEIARRRECQSQLKTLYAESIKGCHMEFSAYNILCVILHANNSRDLVSAMSSHANISAAWLEGSHGNMSVSVCIFFLVSLVSTMPLISSVETKKDEAVKHALAIHTAVTSGNYVRFFRLYKTAPNLNACLMDLYVEKMRYTTVRCVSRSSRPTVPVSYIAQAHDACLVIENTGEMQLDTKASSSTLYMPEPDDAVAHGDASLAVNDFLTRNSS